MKSVPRNDEPAPRGRASSSPDDAGAPSGGAARRDDALLPGTRVEEFEIERVLSTSSFGLVYLATDRAFERRVAIKEYLPDTLAVRAEDGVQVLLRAGSHAEAFERGRRAFAEEAQLLSRLDHPSLLRVLRHWETNGTVYRAMPYYPGTPLLRLREAMGTPPDEATLRALIEGLLEPLALLHAAGCVHREITPSSILLLPDDRPVLMDWGAARRAIVGDQARALMTLLAPSFAPLEVTAPMPERPPGPWTDLYALGAVVRYCISGQLPPPAALRTLPVDEPIGRMLARLRLVNPSLHYSPSFVAAIDAALMPRAEDRPQSVDELHALLDDHPVAQGERVEPGFDAANEGWREEPREAERPEPAMASTPVHEADDDTWVPTVVQMRPPADTPVPPMRTPAMSPEDMSPAAVDRPVQEPPESASANESDIDEEPLFARPGDYGSAPAESLPGFRDGTRRRGRRVALSAVALALLAVGAGAWWLDQQRTNAEAQSAFARAAKENGLPAQVAAAPAPAPVVAAPAPAPVVAAPAPVPSPPAPVVAAAPPAPAPVVSPAVAAPAPEPAPPVTTAAVETPRDVEPAPAPPRSATTARKPTTSRTIPVSTSGTRAASGHALSAAKPAQPARAAPQAAQGPRDACGNRTQFSLYRCMQTQCEKTQWYMHPSCKRLRLRDEVD